MAYSGYENRRRARVGFQQGNSARRNWSWGNYGSFGTTLVEEDDELFIANHDNYFTPRTYEINSRLPYGMNVRNSNNIKLIKEFSRFFFHKMLDDKDYIDINYQDETTMTEEQLEERDGKVPFYEDLWDKYIPGYTPLEKAISLFNTLQENQKGKDGSGDFGEAPTEDMRSALDDVKFEEELWADPEYNELLDPEFLKQRSFNKVNILNKISLIKNLGSQFKIEKDITEKVVPNSNLIAKKMMRDYSQLFNIELYQRLFPDFETKLATKNLTVNVPVEKTEHKQKIIILLDFSGSMSNVQKQEWVCAILIDRMKYAMKEEAEVFFSYFVDDPDQLHFHHVYNRESALAFWNQFSTMPTGGDTHIGAMINRIDHEINSRGRLMNLDVDLREEQPEILIVNDGDDTVKTKEFEYKTNAISLYRNNEELKKLCVDNEGKYVCVEGRDVADVNVTTYSKEGIEKLII